jgi:hypothetical protein
MPPDPIADYLDALTRELAFDPALSRRVRQEVEDHLREAAAAEATGSAIGAEISAIARFGAPQQIAAPYKTLSLHMRMKRTGLFALGAILAAFVAMESRVIWYRLTQWNVGETLKAASATIIPIDRVAFLLAITLGVAGSIYIITRPIPVASRPASRHQVRRGQALIAMAAAAAVVAVVCETILTTWRLTETAWTLASLLPAATIMLEAAIVCAAVVYIRNTILRASGIMDHEAGGTGSGSAG